MDNSVDSAVTDLRMREKTRFCVDFFISTSIYLIYLSVASSPLQVTVLGAILTLSGSKLKRRDFATIKLGAFWWSR